MFVPLAEAALAQLENGPDIVSVQDLLAVYTGLAIVTWLLLQTKSMPVSRFWPLQFIEGGCLLVLSVLLIAATIWLVRRRAA